MEHLFTLSDEGDLLETICEDRDSYKTDSTGRYLYVEFITDSQGGDEGFKMSYTIAGKHPALQSQQIELHIYIYNVFPADFLC